MVCCTLDDLEQFACGALNGEASAVIESHLADCPACSHLFGEVTRNLQFASRLQIGFGTEIAVGIDRTTEESPQRPAVCGTPKTIGAYEIVREIGRGGMGVVYEAMQRDPRRPVALKVLNAVHAAKSTAAALFRREAQALALLSHPGIASIYEAGCTSAGQPFLVMERVEGRPLTTYVTQADLSLRDRLHLFIRVCDAIVSAHQRGVLHRDLKPSNILVRADGTPKVLDFGLARMFAEKIGISHTASRCGDEPDSAEPVLPRVFGTLPYMSPEQARGRENEIDVRSDVYSLGVILYEMLTGSLPYEINPTDLIGSATTICNQPPRRPRAILPRLDSDLEMIVLRSLEKEPAHRYGGVDALRDDLQRYLDDQPILARPSTRTYVLRKFIARNRIPVASAAALAFLLILFTITVSVLAVRINAERQAAIAAKDDVEARLAEAVEQADYLLNSVVPHLDQMIGTGEINDAIAEEVHRVFADLAERYPDHLLVQKRYWESLRLLSYLYAKRGDLESSRQAMIASHDLVVRAAEAHSDNPDIQFQLAYSLLNFAGRVSGDEPETAKRHLLESVSLLESLAANEPLEPLYQRELGASLAFLATIIRGEDETAAEDLLIRAVSHYAAARDLEPHLPIRVLGLAGVKRQLADLLRAQKRFGEAEAHMREAVAAVENASTRAPDNAMISEAVADTHLACARLLIETDRLDDAEQHARRAMDVSESLLEAEPANPARRGAVISACGLAARIAADLSKPDDAASYRRRIESLRSLTHDE